MVIVPVVIAMKQIFNKLSPTAKATLISGLIASLVAVLAALISGYFLLRAQAQNAIQTQRLQVEQARWELKRKACLAALRIVDIQFENFVARGQVTGMSDVKFAESPRYRTIDNDEVRQIISELSLSCDDPSIITLFIKAIDGHTSMDIVVDLRNAARRELGFTPITGLDRTNAWHTGFGRRGTN